MKTWLIGSATAPRPPLLKNSLKRELIISQVLACATFGRTAGVMCFGRVSEVRFTENLFSCRQWGKSYLQYKIKWNFISSFVCIALRLIQITVFAQSISQESYFLFFFTFFTFHSALGPVVALI